MFHQEQATSGPQDPVSPAAVAARSPTVTQHQARHDGVEGASAERESFACALHQAHGHVGLAEALSRLAQHRRIGLQGHQLTQPSAAGA
jgi:hypothetical protein